MTELSDYALGEWVRVTNAHRYNELWQGQVGVVVEDTRGYHTTWPVILGLFRPDTGLYEEDSFKNEELTRTIPTDAQVARHIARILEDS